MDNLQDTLQRLLNQFSAENESNTPDFILARYIMACLAAYNAAVKERERWYGYAMEPGKGPVKLPKE